MQANDLIFSTQTIKSKPVWGIWVFIIVFPILAFIALPVLWATLVTGFAIGIAIVGFIKINQTQKSYVELYSKTIVGIDTKGVSFELQYNEVSRCDYQPELVRIYWTSGYYEVCAPNCEQQVINIIKQQQAINDNT